MDGHLEGTQITGVESSLGFCHVPPQLRGQACALGGDAHVKEKASGGENRGAFSEGWGHFPREGLASCTPTVLHTLCPAARSSCRPLTLRRLMPTSLLGGVKCSSSSKWMSPRRQACANSCPLPSKTRGQPRCRPGQGRGSMDTGVFVASRGSKSRSGSNSSGLLQQAGVESKHLETAAQQTSPAEGRRGCPPNA